MKVSNVVVEYLFDWQKKIHFHPDDDGDRSVWAGLHDAKEGRKAVVAVVPPTCFYDPV